MIPGSMLEVILFVDRRFVRSLEFTDTSITVGSAANAMIRLDEPAAAPQHAVIHFTGRTCVIEDQGAPSGTWCGGQRIDSHIVKPSDEIVIGRYGLRFVIHAQ